jgi:hypothetical protein
MGHTETQLPHEMHLPSSTMMRSSSRMASAGHTLMQVAHSSHNLKLTLIMMRPFCHRVADIFASSFPASSQISLQKPSQYTFLFSRILSQAARACRVSPA